MGLIKLKNKDEIVLLRRAGRVVASVLKEASCFVRPGVSTADLDRLCEQLIRQQGGEPVFIGYRGYRHATCISVNEEVVHGIPGRRILQEGDIVSLDIGVALNGYCGDTAATFPVGKISAKAEKLLRAGREALKAAIRQARPGKHLGDIGHAVSAVGEKYGYGVVRDLYGHGIGRDLHEDPLIPNYGEPGEGPELRPGMVLAIEPMLNLGGWRVKTLPDGWTVVTEDGSWSCHFEHTIAITDGEPEILTVSS